MFGQEPLTTVAARWSAQQRDANEVAAALARTQSEVTQLQRSIGAIESDMTRVKTQAAQQDAREKAFTTRMASIEDRVERFATQLTQVTAKTPPAKGAPPAQARIGAFETSALPAKETAKEAPAAAAPQGAAAPEPQVASSAAVLLTRGPSLDALRLSWSLLSERHKTTLGSFEPRVVSAEPGSYQLVAGPIANAAEAAKVCATLRSRGVACQPATFKGDGL